MNPADPGDGFVEVIASEVAADPGNLALREDFVTLLLERDPGRATTELAAFEARAVGEGAVQQCYRVSPGPDLVLVLWLPDMAAYHALVQRLFTQDANVRNVKAFFATHRAKFAPAVQLPGTAA